MTGEFNVYWWDIEDRQYEEMRFVDPESAVRAAHRLTNGPAAIAGFVNRVIITDGGDCINLEWVKGKGIIFGGEK